MEFSSSINKFNNGIFLLTQLQKCNFCPHSSKSKMEFSSSINKFNNGIFLLTQLQKCNFCPHSTTSKVQFLSSIKISKMEFSSSINKFNNGIFLLTLQTSKVLFLSSLVKCKSAHLLLKMIEEEKILFPIFLSIFSLNLQNVNLLLT